MPLNTSMRDVDALLSPAPLPRVAVAFSTAEAGRANASTAARAAQDAASPEAAPPGADSPNPDEGTRTRTITKPVPKTTPGKPMPRWKVLLHNDAVNDTRYVIRTLMQLVHLDYPVAMNVMLEAHRGGVALVLVTHKERAELYKDQFASKGLTASIEPDSV